MKASITIGSVRKYTDYVIYADGVRAGGWDSRERAQARIEKLKTLPQGPKSGVHNYEIKVEVSEGMPVYF